jgi:hypothetical protein
MLAGNAANFAPRMCSGLTLQATLHIHVRSDSACCASAAAVMNFATCSDVIRAATTRNAALVVQPNDMLAIAAAQCHSSHSKAAAHAYAVLPRVACTYLLPLKVKALLRDASCRLETSLRLCCVLPAQQHRKPTHVNSTSATSGRACFKY